MSKISSSADRNTFQKENYIRHCEEKGLEPSQAYLDWFDRINQEDEYNLTDPEWQKNNMEYDMRSTEWLVEKVRNSDVYAQNLYAAMCNMRFQKLDVIPILKEEYWSCSWRSAGGVVADLRGEGDYIDWYCSGMGRYAALSEEDGGLEINQFEESKFVPEGTITEEIRQDLRKLGWKPVPYED
jgi:hypothetical protein